MIRREATSMLIELPPYRMPRMRTIGVIVWSHAREFLRRAGTTIFAVSIIVWMMVHIPFGAQPADSVVALPAGAAALLFSDGHLERYDGNGVQVATGTLADSRLTLTDLVAEADGGTVGLVDTRGAIPAAQRTLLARFDQDLRLLAMEGPPGLMAVLPFEAPRGFGAQFLHRSAGGWVVATRTVSRT